MTWKSVVVGGFARDWAFSQDKNWEFSPFGARIWGNIHLTAILRPGALKRVVIDRKAPRWEPLSEIRKPDIAETTKELLKRLRRPFNLENSQIAWTLWGIKEASGSVTKIQSRCDQFEADFTWKRYHYLALRAGNQLFEGIWG